MENKPTEIRLEPNYAVLFSQFLREAGLQGDRVIATGQLYAVQSAREVIVPLAIAASSITSVAELEKFRGVISDLSSKLAKAADELQDKRWEETMAQKKKPSEVRIKKEIAALTKIKPKVKKTSLFNDNHHDAIDAQIEVLTEKLSEEDIDNREGIEWKENVAGAARDARHWLDGTYDTESLVGDWQSLVIK